MASRSSVPLLLLLGSRALAFVPLPAPRPAVTSPEGSSTSTRQKTLRRALPFDAAVAVPIVAGTTAALTVLREPAAIDDKREVEGYFNGEVGFGRWNKIYSDTDDVNSVQLDIRVGHQETVDKVLEWAAEESVAQKTWCDLGCGVGSLAIPVAKDLGAKVHASDISAAMVAEASRRAGEAGVSFAECVTQDLEAASGAFDVVSCVDVMIHYPTDKMVDMVQKLASLSTERLFVSFAPKTPQYVALKAIGGLFPGPSKTTRAYLHAEKDVEAALRDAGFDVKRRHLTAKNFYFSTLFEAVPRAQQ